MWRALILSTILACSGGKTGDSVGETTSSTPGTTAVSTDTTQPGTSPQYDCDSPGPDWLMCEDFEDGAAGFDAWLDGSDFIEALGSGDRGRIDVSQAETHRGDWSIHYPAAESAGNQGSALNWWACDGEQDFNCNLRSYDTLYLRAWVRFAPDHVYSHHFLNIAGSQPDDFWPHGTAGCLPNGSLSMGTTVDHRPNSHESFFYTYSPEMNCDANCGNYADVAAICDECASKDLPTCDSQQQCCWGNLFESSAPVNFPTGDWFCFEMSMTANTPSVQDGAMAYWVDDALVHEENTMMWRTSPTLALNRISLQHYITQGDAEGFANQVWFDDVVVSTSRIGCD